jgi:N-acetylmuramoyl-L-alanine amidase
MAQIKVLLQAGHQNTTTGATGAPEERDNNIRIRDRVGQILVSKGFQVFLGDANYSSKEHFDLALALHCDANYAGNEGGGFIACADPSIDGVWSESDRIRDAMTSEYFNRTGIRQVQSRENPNTLYYYWWYMLSLDTPCVLIEMGESIDPHDKVILADTQRVAEGIARGICKAFNKPYDQTTPPPVVTPTITIPQTDYDAMKKKINDLTEANKSLVEQIALKDQDCQQKLKDQRIEMVKKITDLTSTL